MGVRRRRSWAFHRCRPGSARAACDEVSGAARASGTTVPAPEPLAWRTSARRTGQPDEELLALTGIRSAPHASSHRGHPDRASSAGPLIFLSHQRNPVRHGQQGNTDAIVAAEQSVQFSNGIGIRILYGVVADATEEQGIIDDDYPAGAQQP